MVWDRAEGGRVHQYRPGLAEAITQVAGRSSALLEAQRTGLGCLPAAVGRTGGGADRLRGFLLPALVGALPDTIS